jgi:hypothetical protein
MLKHLTFIFISFLFFNQTLFTIEDKQLPEDLLEWKAWVLEDIEDKECPINYQKNTPVCSWYTHAKVSLSKQELDFTMKVQLYKDKNRVLLPFAHQSWAKNVHVNGEKAVVTGSSTKPMVILDKGLYEITGSIPIQEDLKYIQLPKSLALVELEKEGVKVENPKIDTNGRLWLDNDANAKEGEGSVVVSLYRKLIDGHPLRMQTHLHFRVSGEMRSVTLDGVLLDGFLPLGVRSKLNVTITEEKSLKVEVKAGEWTASIDSYHPQFVSKLQIPKYSFPYASEEVWSLQNNASYRTIEVAGVTSIDSSQTTLPDTWKALPAYLVQENETFTIKELYKSAKQQQKSELKLNREMWLDFDGTGYTVDDSIDAKISQVRRLEANSLLDLASASINGQPALITTLENSTQKGVELREVNMNIETSSRYEGDITLPPANGWSEQFNSIRTKLHLPPGWELFAAFGSDNRSSAWVEKWSLMDIFLVLLLAIAIYQLYGWKWAVPATLFVILLWHESDAPTIVWLFVVLLVALLRVVTEGRLKKFLQFTGAIVVAIALLQVLSFTVYEIRTALYSQLEKKDYTSYYDYEEDSFGYSNVQAPMPKSSRNIYKGKKMEMMNMVQQEQRMSKMMQNRIDPNAVVQTGIGKPSWSWKSYTFSWQSGVSSEDRLELWLISPFVLKILKVLNIVGMFFLLYLFLHEFGKSLVPSIKKGLGAKSTAMGLLFVSLLVMTPQKSYADIPPPELLKELKERLTEAPACLPNCAQMDEVNVSIEEDRLTVHLNISAGSDISVPLLGNRNVWLPEEVLLNGAEAKGLSLDKNGGLWLMLTQGVHQVQLKGTLKGQHQVMLNSRLPLHNLQINARNPLWKITSDKKSYIEINSLKQEEQEDKAKSTLKPLIEVTRTLYFGQYWYIDTEVKLLNKIEKPYTLRYPLLPDESILGKEVEEQNNQALLHLSSKRPRYEWRSSLPITSTLALKAMQNDQVIEVWQMDISTIWDMNFQGIEPIAQLMDRDIIMPRFKPWQGEELTLNLERTKAVKGENLTIESSQLKVTQSGRYRDVTLNLSLKSSQAGQYTIALKDVKELKPTIIDGRTHYLKVSDGLVSIPLHAKAQKVKLSWREEIGAELNYQFPTIDLKKASTNSEIKLTLPHNRWILWTGGPTLGPAVLLWGVILALLIVAFVLGKVQGSPLKTQDWLLLGIGVSTTSVMILLPIVIWIFALRYREYRGNALEGWKRNLTQVGLVILTFVALGTIIGAVSSGLLGNPDMMIAGNSSYGNHLNWYSDRIAGVVPEPTVFSVSIWYYRVLMLLWSIWVAFALIRWLKWAWAVFSQGEMWSRWRSKKDEK